MMLRFYYDLNLGLRAPDYFLKRDYSGAAYRKSLFFAFPSKVRVFENRQKRRDQVYLGRFLE